MKTLTFIKPDDWHLHLRDGDYLNTTVPLSAERFARAIVMPNLKPPVTSVTEAENYHQRILTAIPEKTNFFPLMTLYLTDSTKSDIVRQAKQSKFIYAFKLYPAGATTHSAAGVSQLEKIYPALEAMEENDLPLLVHAEATAAEVDIFDREKHFLDYSLSALIKRFPKLRIVVEHVSSQYGIDWVKTAPKNIAATITVHHLLLNRNNLLVGGIHPHLYCLPILKTQKDREALIAAATSGNPKFFLGTDSAPHPQSQKESSCGCAGIFTSHAAIELYAEVFEQAKALDKLEAFASFYGADFYRLPRNKETITLAKETWQVPSSLPFANEKLIPFRAGEKVNWKSIQNKI
jgi:dihydroorotase